MCSFAQILLFFKLLSFVVRWGLDFRFGLTLGLIRARVTLWVKFKVGVRTRIAFFFLFARWHAHKLCIFQMIWFYGLPLEIKLGLKFYHYPIPERDGYIGRYQAKLVYCIGSVPLIKYRLSVITLNYLFFRASTSDFGLYLLSMNYVCNSLSLEEDY